jgi:flagellar biosynthesis/type III secretory pathway ATPase
VGASENLFGRTIDCLGDPVDGMGAVSRLEPVPLRRPARRGTRLALRIPLGLDGAPGVFRGAHALVTHPWPRAGRLLARIARSWRKPIVAVLVGGGILEHSLFSADLAEAFYRCVMISEPGGRRPFRAMRAYRVAAALAGWFGARAGDALLVVGWRVRGLPAVADTTVAHAVTSIWSIEGVAAGFDLEIGPGAAERRAA